MKKISFFFTSLIMLLLTTTWSIKAVGDSMLPSDLAGKWFIKEVNGKKIVNALAYIEFDIVKKKIHSKTACNYLDVSYAASGSNLSINMDKGEMTLMNCRGLMELEEEIIAAMGKITNFVGSKKVLKNVDLKDDSGDPLLKLQR